MATETTTAGTGNADGGGDTGDGADGGDTGEAASAAAAAATSSKIKADLGDGKGERELDLKHLIELGKRGLRSSQILSKAEQRAQEATQKELEIRSQLECLKDPNKARALLKKLGVDVRGMSMQEINEAIEEEKLTPEQKKIREQEAKLKEVEDKEKAEKENKNKSEKQKALDANADEFGNLFVDVMERLQLPKSSGPAVASRLAPLYEAADATGVEVDLELAVERVKTALKNEQKALFYKTDKGPDGKPTKVLDVDAMEDWFTPEEWKAINRHALMKYRAGKSGGKTPPPAPVRPKPANGQGNNGNGGTQKKKSAQLWAEILG